MKRTTSLPTVGLSLALLVTSLSGCSTTPKVAKQPTALQAAGMTAISGKVVETTNAGGYTYVLLEKEGKKTWAALPTMKVAVGQELNLLPGAEMNQFESKTLQRTFDKIIFSGGLVPDPKEAAAEVQDPNLSDKAILAGKLVEKIDASNYTYLLIEKDGKKAWSAVPTTGAKVGDEIELIPGMDMGEFKSTTLKKTFKNIHFSAGVKGEAAKKQAAQAAAKQAVPENHPPVAEGAAPAAAKLPEGHPPMPETAAPAAEPAAAAPLISGKVVETMNGGGYTYVCVEKEGKKTWAAVPSTEVKVGEEIALLPGNEMAKFTSKTLNRTFDSIIFSGGRTALPAK